jgi:putative chitinase
MKQHYFPKVKFLFSVFLLIATANCTRDDFSDLQQIEEENTIVKAPFQIDYLSANQAPVFVKEMLPSHNRENNVASSNNYTDAETGAVFDEQTIMKVTDTLGNTNYTIRFGFPHTPERIFYNLIVGRDAQGVMNEPYIVRYVSDSTAFDAFKNSNYDFRKFRGKMTYHKYADFFGTNKSLIGDLVVANRANSRSQTAIDTQTACEPELDEFGDPIACETITISGGTSGSSGGSGGSGEGLPPGGSAGTDSGVDSDPPDDGSTSDGTREPEDPIDPGRRDPCCDLGGGTPVGSGIIKVGVSISYNPIADPSGGSGLCSEIVVTYSELHSDGRITYSSRVTGINCVYFDETGTIKTAANSFEECPECVPPAEGGIGVLPPKGTTEEVVNEDCNTSKEDLKKLFPNISDANAELLASIINEKGQDFGIDSAEKLQHFLAQAGHETGGFNTMNVTEDLNYTTTSRIPKMWDKFTTDTIANPTKLYAGFYTKNAEKLANAAYCCKYGNGNEASGEGWKYRGRGIFQLTWKDNYQAFKTFYNNKYDPDIDPVAEPEIIATNKDLAILSGLWYFKIKVLDKIAIDSTTSVVKVTIPINPAKVGIEDRKERFQKAKDSINCL